MSLVDDLNRARDLLPQITINGEYETTEGCVFTSFAPNDDPMTGCIFEPSRHSEAPTDRPDDEVCATAEFATLAMNVLVQLLSDD